MEKNMTAPSANVAEQDVWQRRLLPVMVAMVIGLTITTHNAIEVKDGPQYTSLPFLVERNATSGKPEDPARLDAAGGGAAINDASDRENPMQNVPASNGGAPEVNDLTDAMFERLNKPPSAEGRP